MKIFCVECQDHMETELVTGSEIYPHRTDLADKYFYRCTKCGNYVGCHPNTTKPLGCIPNEELKRARNLIHDKLDPLWKSYAYGKSRGWWYSTLAKELGIKEYHTGWTRSVEECRNVWRAINKILKDLENKEKDHEQ